MKKMYMPLPWIDLKIVKKTKRYLDMGLSVREIAKLTDRKPANVHRTIRYIRGTENLSKRSVIKLSTIVPLTKRKKKSKIKLLD